MRVWVVKSVVPGADWATFPVSQYVPRPEQNNSEWNVIVEEQFYWGKIKRFYYLQSYNWHIRVRSYLFENVLGSVDL